MHDNFQKCFGEALTLARDWCRHMETLSDYENRLPRGKEYFTKGRVRRLNITPGHIVARVNGSREYRVSINIDKFIKLDNPRGASNKVINKQYPGNINSMLEHLLAKESGLTIAMTNQSNILFPTPEEIHFSCNCPDRAEMCKHVAATLYGVGDQLAEQPGLLFSLRNVEPFKLSEDEGILPTGGGFDDGSEILDDRQLCDIFDIDIESNNEDV